ncbi:MAG: RagB/SusD family nutrient uptake outer membrane protein [Bacteroidales bacterium]|nr:RagB/SusD family nutrient uptake outer membrane protein [Bacteroidales bacterium]
MKKNISIALISFAILTLSSCNFLDVQPEDRLTQEQLLQTERGVNLILNGIYLEMAHNHLYGANLTMTVLEVLAQRFNVNNTRTALHFLARYEFQDGERLVERVNEQMWQRLFVQALAVNDFLSVLEKTNVIPSQQRINWLRGEALALRAFFHFDILRIWGPSPLDDDNIPFMPYNDVSTGELLPLLTASQVLARILEDLEEAADLLQDDPIRTRGIDTEMLFQQTHDFYQTNRNYRMNFYAVQAMLARVHLWMGNHAAAYGAAREVIDAQGRMTANGPLFPWILEADIITALTPDRIFSTEVIFGIHSGNMYTNANSFFAPALNPENELVPRRNRLEELFEAAGAGMADFRYAHLWIEAAAFGKDYRTFWKYAPPNDRNVGTGGLERTNRTEFFQPLIRISEMFYIAAESKLELGGSTEDIWNNYLNVVRSARNIGSQYPLAGLTPEQLRIEIRREYQKEFWGEGQLFFYYKRLNYQEIPNALTETGNVMPIFRFPMPQFEIIARGQ